MDAAGASVVPRDAIRRLICYTVGMSTTPQHDNHDEYTIETMTAALRERGIAHTVEHTGGGIEVIFVPAGAHEVTISDDWADDGYLAVDRPYHGHLWDDVGDATLPACEGPIEDVLAFIAKVADANPKSYWVWVDEQGEEVGPRFDAVQDANEFAVVGGTLQIRGANPEPIGVRLERAVTAGEQAFWAAIATEFPEARFGDFDGDILPTLLEAAAHWVKLNVPGQEYGDPPAPGSRDRLRPRFTAYEDMTGQVSPSRPAGPERDAVARLLSQGNGAR